MPSEKLINFPSIFVLTFTKFIELCQFLFMRLEGEFPISSQSWIFLLSSIPNNNTPKMKELRGSKAIRLIILRSPSIKPNLIHFTIDIFLNYVANTPVTLIVLSINKVIDIINFPYLFRNLFILVIHLEPLLNYLNYVIKLQPTKLDIIVYTYFIRLLLMQHNFLFLFFLLLFLHFFYYRFLEFCVLFYFLTDYY